MATFLGIYVYISGEEIEMTTVLALEQLEELYLEDLEVEILSTLSGSDANTEFTARVLMTDVHDDLSFEQLVLSFSHAELFRRFGKLSLEAQEQVGLRLLNWAEGQQDQMSSSRKKTPDLKMEVEFPWSGKKRRRLGLFLEREQLMGGEKVPFRNIFLTVTLI